MEEPPVEAAGLELAHRAVIAVRQDRLRAIGRPAIAANPPAIVSSASSQRDPLEPSLPFGADPLQGVQQPVGAVDPVEVAGHLLAEEPAGERMVGIASEVDATPSSTVTRMLHVSGQSSGQTFLTMVSDW